MTSPISNIEQICGRVLRVSEGKKEPLIFDIVDLAYDEICRTFFKRRDYYFSKGWSVRYLRVMSTGEKIEMDEHEAMTLIHGD